MIILLETPDTLVKDLETTRTILNAHKTNDAVLPFQDIKIRSRAWTSSTGEEGDVLFLETPSGELVMTKKSMEDLCKVIKYPMANLSVLDLDNIKCDINYVFSILGNNNKSCVMRFDGNKKVALHCYAMSNNVNCAPLINEDISNIFDTHENIKMLEHDFTLQNSDNVLIHMVSDSMTINYGKEYVLGAAFHFNSSQKGFVNISTTITNEDNKIIAFLGDTPFNRYADCNIPRTVTLDIINEHFVNNSLLSIDRTDITSQLKNLEEATLDSKNVGFIYRGLKGVNGKVKKAIFENYLVKIGDEITDEPKPNEILSKDKNLSVWNLFEAISSYGFETIKSSGGFKIKDPINMFYYCGDLMDKTNKIYATTTYFV